RAGLHRLGVLPPRLAQVGVQVDQAGQGDKPVRVDHLGTGRAALGDDAVVHQQIGPVPAEHRDTLQQVLHLAPPSNRYSTAMRTSTPFATCSTIVDRGESATSGLISIPRFIGPGCITIACEGSARTRSASSPYRRADSRSGGEEAAFLPSPPAPPPLTPSPPASAPPPSQ